MVPIACKIADLGWHIQLFSDSDNVVELAGTLKDMPVPVVFDHMGHLPEPAGPDHPGFEVIAYRSRLARAYVPLAPRHMV